MKKIGKNYVRNIKSKIVLIALLSLVSCQYFSKSVDKTPVAKIYDSYLYFEDISPEIYSRKSPEDSLNALHQFIEEWAYKTLLIKEAERNVDTVKINRLVQQYRHDLLTDTYKELLLQKYIDTVVPPDTLQKYYQKYKAYFIAEQAFIQPKYLVFDKRHPKRAKFKKWFFSDKVELSDSLIKNTEAFTKYDLMGNTWSSMPDFKKNIPVLKRTNDKYILKKSKKFVLTDSLSLYLVFVKDFVSKGQALPLDLVKNDLKQLILSKRKQAALSKLENNIKQEAIKNKTFKTFKIKQDNE